MIKAVIFDMYETLITLFECEPYFGPQIAEETGIPGEIFKNLWKPMEQERTIGKLTLEQALEFILKENGQYSEELLNKIVEKRKSVRRECFERLHPEIIPMLKELKKRGLYIGLISNCFSEEAEVIKESVLFSYFDVACLSYDLGLQKPDKEIYRRCMETLSVEAHECIYIGDGGSRELEAAKELGMKPLQAVWYLKEGTLQPCKRMPEFVGVKTPLEILKHI